MTDKLRGWREVDVDRFQRGPFVISINTEGESPWKLEEPDSPWDAWGPFSYGTLEECVEAASEEIERRRKLVADWDNT